MSLRDRLIRLAAFKLLGDEIAAALAAEKAGLVEEVGGRMGAAAATIDGHEIGTVSIAPGRYPRGAVDGWEVYDPKAWLEWVRGYRPTAIVEQVRASDEKDLLSRIGEIVEENGEAPDGVRPATRGDDYVIVNQTPAQRANAIRAWREGTLQMPGMDPQIEEGPDDEWD